MAMEDATLIKHTKQAFVLRSISGDEEYTLQGEMLVGREVECAIPLNSGHVSRYHAKINVSPNGVYVEDLHSTNGTFVNGQKIKGRVRLSVGDELTFDDIHFRLTSNLSGEEAATLLTPRRHSFQESPVKAPIRPQAVPIKPSASAMDSNKQISGGEAFVEQAPAALAINTPEIAEQEASPVAEGDGTQILSAIQLHHLVERNKFENAVNVGTGPRLIVMTAPIRGKIFTLSSAGNLHNWQIGRDSHSEICLNDKTISNDHARITVNAQGYFLTATHAKNGIFVNGEPTTKIHLSHNDKIQIGSTELLFKTDQAPAQSPTHYAQDPITDTIKMRRYGIIATVMVFAVLTIAILSSGH